MVRTHLEPASPCLQMEPADEETKAAMAVARAAVHGLS
jgi:hypothetical protein